MSGRDHLTCVHFIVATDKGERAPGILFRQNAPGHRTGGGRFTWVWH
jgi:hypothetical protein